MTKDRERTNLLDESLREFAKVSDDGASQRQVVVELALPATRVATSRDSHGRIRPVAVESDDQQRSAEAEIVTQAISAVQAITGSEPNYIRAAKALVARVTPAQLRQLMALPEVRAIRENRKLTR